MKKMNLVLLAVSALSVASAFAGDDSGVKFFYNCSSGQAESLSLHVMKNTAIETSGDDLQGQYSVEQSPAQIAGIVQYTGTVGGLISQEESLSSLEAQQSLLDGKDLATAIIDGETYKCTLLTPAQPAVSVGNVAR